MYLFLIKITKFSYCCAIVSILSLLKEGSGIEVKIWGCRGCFAWPVSPAVYARGSGTVFGQ